MENCIAGAGVSVVESLSIPPLGAMESDREPDSQLELKLRSPLSMGGLFLSFDLGTMYDEVVLGGGGEEGGGVTVNFGVDTTASDVVDLVFRKLRGRPVEQLLLLLLPGVAETGVLVVVLVVVSWQFWGPSFG